jgi:integrase
MIPPEVYAKCLVESSGDFHQLIRVWWATGARPMEAASLTAEAIDWATGTATIRRHKTRKKGKRRVLYFHTEALAVLREQADKYGGGPLFRGVRGDALTLRAIVDRCRRLSAKVGRPVRAYDFRHTFITRSLMKGVPAAVVAALVGTSTGMIDRFYGHVSAQGQQLRDVAERLAG